MQQVQEQSDVGTGGTLSDIIRNERGKEESFPTYKERLSTVQKMMRIRLRMRNLFWDSRNKGTYKRETNG